MPKREPYICNNGTVYIRLTMGFHTVIDLSDLPLVSGHNWQARERSDGKGLYACCGKLRMHRVIMGAGPADLVDHRNGDGLFNRRRNLRIATRVQNAQNRRPIDRALPVGVRKINDRFYAQINSHGRRAALGGYATPQEAHEAYLREAVDRYGEWLHPSLRDVLDR